MTNEEFKKSLALDKKLQNELLKKLKKQDRELKDIFKRLDSNLQKLIESQSTRNEKKS